MSDNYLEHHGILGQKWGVRRYQNRDGSLTALGKKHLETDQRRRDAEEAFRKIPKSKTITDEELMSDNKRQALERQYEKNHPDGDTTWKIGETAKQSIDSAKRATDAIDRATRKRTQIHDYDVSKLSDAELQKIVNRMNLENNYKRLNTIEVSNKAVESVRETLEVVGSTVGISVGIATILAYIRGHK